MHNLLKNLEANKIASLLEENPGIGKISKNILIKKLLMLKKLNICRKEISISHRIFCYGPQCYLMHLTDRCQFLNCSVRMGVGENKRGGRVGWWGVGGGE
jgi:hypothetical protein